MLAILGLALSTIIVFRSVDLPPPADPEAEYYRGAYDVCLQQVERVDFCLSVIGRMKDDDWYGQQSGGWRWPVEEARKVG
jgi:hypothetical protein